jgi:hypothetical protein
MDRTIEEMKLDIISWRLEGTERAAEQEFKELCREKPREYGDKPGCKRLNTYKAEFYKYLVEDVLYIIDESGNQIRKEWEQESIRRNEREVKYAE